MPDRALDRVATLAALVRDEHVDDRVREARRLLGRLVLRGDRDQAGLRVLRVLEEQLHRAQRHGVHLHL